MPAPLEVTDIALRLALALLAGAILGIDRTSRGRPAGMRTTMMVTAAGAVAMVLADLVSQTGSAHEGTSTRFDPLRMAQGILAGMGFIGAGAIVRRGDVVHGVTTAATLWFSTVVGLCFGSGEWRVGTASMVVGLLILWPLNYLENCMKREHTGTLAVTAPIDAMSENDLRELIHRHGYITTSWSVELDRLGLSRELSCRVLWKARPTNDRIPPFIAELSSDSKVSRVKWEPVLS